MADGSDQASTFARLYEAKLSELTFNSKPIINSLTMIAGENRAHAELVVASIQVRKLQPLFVRQMSSNQNKSHSLSTPNKPHQRQIYQRCASELSRKN